MKLAGRILAIPVLMAPSLAGPGDLTPEGRRMLGLFLMAIVLWVTEAIPLHATAILIILAEILLISDQSLVTASPGFTAPAYSSFFAALAHPVLMLFLGGFILADGAAKFRLDRNLAGLLLRPFGSQPKWILLGLMLITALFSMFMSNTATTATFMAVIFPVAMKLPEGDRLRTALALAIPVAANVGGIGTPVGTPPNAIAVGSLAEAGISISFLKWMALAVPMMVVLLAIAWWILLRLYRSETTHLDVEVGSSFDRTLSARVFYGAFSMTVILWLTEPLHGIPSSIVGFMPVVLLMATGIVGTKDLQSIQWHVLWLVAGGIALGAGVSITGLDEWMLSQIDWSNMVPTAIAIGLALVTLALSTVISNSATANLIIPIGLSIGTSSAIALEPLRAVFFVAIGASLAMALPISTPPNAVAYATGMVQTRDLAITGVIIGAVGLVLYLGVAPLLWALMGVS